MPPSGPRPGPSVAGDLVAQATALARDLAPDLASVLLTHFADADTLDMLRPGETDLTLVAGINRAVATELAAEGVEIFVQRADRAAFRRWMDGREDTQQARRGWIDRGRLLHGAEALRLLGVKGAMPPLRPIFGKAPGPTANLLVAAFSGESDRDFESLAQALLDAGREDVLELAIRKLEAREGEEAADALATELLTVAEAGRLGPSGWAALVALPVALPARDLPDATAMAESLRRAEFLPDSVEYRFLPGWRAAEAIATLSPVALRRVLADLVAGAEPRDLPPGDTDDLARQGFGVLFGLQIDWDIPIWDQIAADGLPVLPEEGEDETPDQARRNRLFDGWRAAMFETHAGCVPLALVSPSEIDDEIEDFVAQAGAHTGGLDEIRQFVSVARDEAGVEEVVCRAELVGDGLELSLYTEAGRFLDSLTLSAAQMPARADEMLGLIAAFVRVVKDTPG